MIAASPSVSPGDTNTSDAGNLIFGSFKISSRHVRLGVYRTDRLKWQQSKQGFFPDDALKEFI